MNPLSPDFLSTEERIAEICDLLATGLVRLRARANGNRPGDECAPQSSELSRRMRESSVDFSAPESGHATTLQWRPGA